MNYQSLADIQTALLNNEITVESLVNHYLNNIDKTKNLNAFIHVFDDVINKAKALDEKIKSGLPYGKLFGAVISIKDNICIKGKPISAASKILANYVSPYSATVIDRIENEDAIIIGTTNCDEFGMGSASLNSAYGPVKNGIDDNLIAGGSSGGAAVSIQMNCCNIALGSDTGGSIRQPASLTNVIGMKPTYGTVSRYGLIAYASSFDQIGILSKDIHAVKMTLSIISGIDDFDSTLAIKKFDNKKYDDHINIALIPAMFDSENTFTNECKQAIHSSLSFATFTEEQFDYMKYLVSCYYILTTAEASSNLSRYDGVRYGHRSLQSSSLNDMYVNSRTEGFGEEVKKRIMLGTFVLSEGYFDAYYQKAQKIRRLITEQIEDILTRNHAIAMPVTPSPAWSIDKKIEDPIEIYLSDIYTVLANITGLPSISIPVIHNGKTVNYQLLGRRGEDMALMNLVSSIL
jgi:aspartyl-tRNA(Asn)/glutamyl-tRNA(Gln) amidotransferase subunit A